MHKFRISYLLILPFLIFIASCNESAEKKSSKTDGDEIDQKVSELLSKMTLEEKAGQLIQYNGSWDVTGPVPEGDNEQRKYQNIKEGKAGSMLNVIGAEATKEIQKLTVENSRLGIPLLFAYDVIHGYKTMFPIPLAEASSWDMEIIEKGSAIAAKESAAAGLHWTFAPMLDISRDARWGRMMETNGEDPYLGSKIAEARIKGLQGSDLSDVSTILACAKHFAAYGFAEAGRDYNTVEMSDYTLHNVVLPPFKSSIDAGARTVMNAFNIYNQVPATGNVYLQRDILKGDWGFSGAVVSDWGSIGEQIVHGAAKDTIDAAKQAIEAGSDIDMESRCYESLVQMVNDGIIDEALIDDAASRVLRLKYELGLFDDPYKYSDEEREKAEIYSEENRAIAKESALESMVLLKNEGLLPLENVKSVGVIGTLANSKDIPLGSWRAQAVENSAVSLLEGLQNVMGKSTKIEYAEGYKLAVGRRSFVYELTFEEKDRSGFAEAIALAKRSEVIVMALGEDCWQSGEARSQVDIGLKGLQLELFKEIQKVNKNIVVVLMNGRPLAIPEVAELAPSILEAWHLGSEAGNAIAEVLAGNHNPSGKLPVSFPRHVGQVPIYYNHFNTGRPTTNEHDAGFVFWSHYSDELNSPQYAFGHGLSYSNFEYSDMKLSSDEMTKGGEITCSVNVKNTSDRDGEEVIQFYIRDLFGSIARPVQELKGFEKLMIKAGEEKKVEFKVDEELLFFYRKDKTWGVEPGKFHAMVGGSSDKVIKAEFELK
ncbi:MAG: beta-glucosidase BglX [Bacteroidota bacterium]